MRLAVTTTNVNRTLPAGVGLTAKALSTKQGLEVLRPSF